MRIARFRRLWLTACSRGKIAIGPAARIESGAILDTRRGGTTSIGARCHLARGSILAPYGGRIIIGDDFSLNPYSILYGHGGLTIGNGVRIAAGTVVIPANHIFSNLERPIHKQGLSRCGITIEDDVWIGANVAILDGAHIARGTVIGAGSVVRGRTKPMGVYAGVPARLIKKRGDDLDRIR